MCIQIQGKFTLYTLKVIRFPNTESQDELLCWSGNS